LSRLGSCLLFEEAIASAKNMPAEAIAFHFIFRFI